MEGEFVVIPYSRCKLPKSRGCFPDTTADFSVKWEIVGDGGPKIGKTTYSFQCLVVNGDEGRMFIFLSHYLGFVQADG